MSTSAFSFHPIMMPTNTYRMALLSLLVLTLVQLLVAATTTTTTTPPSPVVITPPVTTTKAPVTTTKAPVTTTAAPVTTTTAPAVTTTSRAPVSTTTTGKPYEVVYAINAGGQEHIDEHGIRYERDPQFAEPNGGIGTASDYGRQLLTVGRVGYTPDEYLYQTERYHTSTFGYDLPVTKDGKYVLLLKFCEVYFSSQNLKVFDVVLNQEHTIITDLDIYKEAGHGSAHDVHIPFSVLNGRLHFGDQVSLIRSGRIRVEFIKGYRDNPKVNAIALFRGENAAAHVPRLLPVPTEIEWDADFGEAEAELDDPIVVPYANQKQLHQKQAPVSDASADSGADTMGDFVGDEEDERDVRRAQANAPPTKKGGGGRSTDRRKTSGPRQEDPYALDDSSVMLPVFIAIGAFIPLLFCLCKL